MQDLHLSWSQEAAAAPARLPRRYLLRTVTVLGVHFRRCGQFRCRLSSTAHIPHTAACTCAGRSCSTAANALALPPLPRQCSLVTEVRNLAYALSSTRAYAGTMLARLTHRPLAATAQLLAGAAAAAAPGQQQGRRQGQRQPEPPRAVHASGDGAAPGALPEGGVPPRPVEPGPDECCGRGCNDCVWTLYWEVGANGDHGLGQAGVRQALAGRQAGRVHTALCRCSSSSPCAAGYQAA